LIQNSGCQSKRKFQEGEIMKKTIGLIMVILAIACGKHDLGTATAPKKTVIVGETEFNRELYEKCENWKMGAVQAARENNIQSCVELWRKIINECPGGEIFKPQLKEAEKILNAEGARN